MKGILQVEIFIILKLSKEAPSLYKELKNDSIASSFVILNLTILGLCSFCLPLVVGFSFGKGIFVPQNSQYLPTVPCARQVGHIAFCVIFISLWNSQCYVCVIN